MLAVFRYQSKYKKVDGLPKWQISTPAVNQPNFYILICFEQGSYTTLNHVPSNRGSNGVDNSNEVFPSDEPYRTSREKSTWPGWDSNPRPSVY